MEQRRIDGFVIDLLRMVFRQNAVCFELISNIRSGKDTFFGTEWRGGGGVGVFRKSKDAKTDFPIFSLSGL